MTRTSRALARLLALVVVVAGCLVGLVGGPAAAASSDATSSAVPPEPDPLDPTTDPVLAGSGKVGTVLTVTDPEWSAPPDSVVRRWYRDEELISGNSGTTYAVVAGDVGKVILVRYVATKTGHTPGTAESNGVTAQIGDAPVGRAPTIVGTPKVGETLSVADATWNPPGPSTSRRWLSDGVPTGATGPTYVVAPGDVGRTIAVRYERAQPGYATGTTQTPPTAPVVKGDAPQPTAAPTIEGAARVGERLTATAPTWPGGVTGSGPQWYRGATAIEGATSSTYDVVPADLGEQLSVRYTGTRPGYEDGAASSQPTAPVVAGTAPQATTAPTVSGNARVGETLTATDPVWPDGVTNGGRQWLRGGDVIAGATGATYVLTADDLGEQVSVRFTGSREGYEDGTATSTPTDAVGLGAAPVNSTVPTVTGTPAVGRTLGVDTGSWSPLPDGYRYQWQRAGTDIAGADDATYVVRAADAGRPIAVRVVATKAGHADSAPATTVAVSVAKVASATRVKLAKARIKASQKPVVTVTVRAPGIARPTGTVRVLAGTKVVGTGKLTSVGKGVVKVTLKKLRKGKHKITATYLGSRAVDASTSRVATLKVV